MKDPAQRLAWAEQTCGNAHMRMTPIREKIIAFLAAQRLPVSLEHVTCAPGMQGTCDTATAYRTLMLLRELEVIRQVSLPNRGSYFVLNIPGEVPHYLVCRCCGALRELPALASLVTVEQEIGRSQDFSRLNLELRVSGLCPACQRHPSGVVCAKIQPRMKPAPRLKHGLPSQY